MLTPAREQNLYSPVPAQVIDEPGRGKHVVRQGDVLLRLSAPDLEHRLRLAHIMERGLTWQVEQQTFNHELLMQGDALKRHSEEVQAQVMGLSQEADQLLVRAPFDGEILRPVRLNTPLLLPK